MEIKPGRVVCVNDLVDTNGRRVGRHAAIILSTSKDKQIKAVVISSKMKGRKESAMVRIKQVLNRPGGHPQTGLKIKCAAMCDWIVELNESDIKEEDWKTGIYGKDLIAIQECVEANKIPPAEPLPTQP